MTSDLLQCPRCGVDTLDLLSCDKCRNEEMVCQLCLDKHTCTSTTNYISSLSGVLKTPFSDTYDKALVKIVGPNESGKTTRLEMLDLIASGDRIDGHVDDLATPLAPVTGSLTVKFHSTNDVITFAYPRGENETNAGRPFVVRPARWLLGYGPIRLRREIVRMFAEDDETTLKAPDSLTPEQSAIWATGLAEVREAIAREQSDAKRKNDDVSDDPIEVLTRLQKWAASKATALTKAINAAITKTELPNVEDVEDLNQRYALAVKWETTAAARAKAEQTQRDYAKYLDDIKVFEAEPVPPSPDDSKLQIALKELGTLEAADRPYDVIMMVMDSRCVPVEIAQWFVTACMYDVMTRAGKDPSILPGVTSETFDVVRPFVESARKASGDAVTAKRAEVTALEHAHAGALSASDAYQRRVGGLATEASRIQTAWAEAQATIGDGAAYNGDPSHVIRQRINAAISAAAIRNEAQRKVQETEAKRIEQMRTKGVADAATIKLTKVIKDVSDIITRAVRKRMPTSFATEFRFDADKCRFEMEGRDGRTHGIKEISRGQYAALALALAQVIPHAADRPTIMVLEYEYDLSPFDLVNQRAVLKLLADAVYEGEIDGVMLASPVDVPTDERWQAIYTGEVTPIDTAPIARTEVVAQQARVLAAPTHPTPITVPITDILAAIERHKTEIDLEASLLMARAVGTKSSPSEMSVRVLQGEINTQTGDGPDLIAQLSALSNDGESEDEGESANVSLGVKVGSVDSVTRHTANTSDVTRTPTSVTVSAPSQYVVAAPTVTAPLKLAPTAPTVIALAPTPAPATLIVAEAPAAITPPKVVTVKRKPGRPKKVPTT